MSDGSSGNAFGEALESMTTNTKQAATNTIKSFGQTAVGQISGKQQGLSGSFTPGQQPANPNAAPGLQGGDLFSPDMNKIQPMGKQQSQSQQSVVNQQGQGMTNDNAKSPEEMAKIKNIQSELQSLHQKYYQDFLAKAEGRDKKTQIEEQKKEQEEEQKKMEDLQKKEVKKQQDQAVFRGQRGAEIKGGAVG